MSGQPVNGLGKLVARRQAPRPRPGGHGEIGHEPQVGEILHRGAWLPAAQSTDGPLWLEKRAETALKLKYLPRGNHSHVSGIEPSAAAGTGAVSPALRGMQAADCHARHERAHVVEVGTEREMTTGEAAVT